MPDVEAELRSMHTGSPYILIGSSWHEEVKEMYYVFLNTA
jgi:hypothetical protein